MDWIIRLILENIWLIVFIIIGLSQFFSSIRTEKKRPSELPDGHDTPDVEELIRRLQEQERKQPTPPPLPPQQPRPQPRKNTIPQASKPHPETLTRSFERTQEKATDASTNIHDAYEQPAQPTPLHSSQQPLSAISIQQVERDIQHLRQQAEAYQLKATGKPATGKITYAQQTWRRLLQNPASTRQAIILIEVLGAPRAYRAHTVGISTTPVV